MLPSEDDAMKMLSDAWNSLDIDLEEALKQNFVMVQNFYGSEHYKLCGKFYLLVFEKMNDFLQELQSLPLPKLLKDLLMMITSLKGICRKVSTNEVLPPDEKIDLFDCKGEKIQVDEVEDHLILMMKISI